MAGCIKLVGKHAEDRGITFSRECRKDDSTRGRFQVRIECNRGCVVIGVATTTVKHEKTRAHGGAESKSLLR